MQYHSKSYIQQTTTMSSVIPSAFSFMVDPALKKVGDLEYSLCCKKELNHKLLCEPCGKEVGAVPIAETQFNGICAACGIYSMVSIIKDAPTCKRCDAVESYRIATKNHSKILTTHNFGRMSGILFPQCCKFQLNGMILCVQCSNLIQPVKVITPKKLTGECNCCGAKDAKIQVATPQCKQCVLMFQLMEIDGENNFTKEIIDMLAPPKFLGLLDPRWNHEYTLTEERERISGLKEFQKYLNEKNAMSNERE